MRIYSYRFRLLILSYRHTLPCKAMFIPMLDGLDLIDMGLMKHGLIPELI
ncbi:MAG: hypothetical protein K0S11_1662 [Gammaproteobacteria bacterium]|nr:hypothetical protein [Gammaproteobacteria bacterium]